MQVRGYASQKKEQCVGTQCDRSPGAVVRSEEKGEARRYAVRQKPQVRRHRERMRCDRSSNCGDTVKVRGAIEAVGVGVQ